MMIKRTSLATLAISVCIFAICPGCSSTKPPMLAVEGGSVTERSDEAIVVDFHLHLRNPNTEPLELLEMNYALRVDGRDVFHARRDAQATLPALGEWTLRVPVVIPFDDAGWSANNIPPQVQYDLAGSLVYSAPGPLAEILLDAGIWRPKAGFHAGGDMTLTSPDAVSAVSVDRE